MAERRMFAKTIVDSDAFLEMPATARLLYYDLGMRADDDGFVNAPKKIMRMIGASEDDLRVLLTRRFILGFESGVIVIKHWRINNYLRNDRHRETVYSEELARLDVKADGAYSEKPVTELNSGIPSASHVVDGWYTQDSIVKDSIVKDSIENRADAPPAPGKSDRFRPPTVEEVTEYVREKGLTVDPEHFVDYYTARGWTLGKGQHMKDWQAAARTWDKLAKEHAAEKKKPDEIIGGETYDVNRAFEEAVERSRREMEKELGL